MPSSVSTEYWHMGGTQMRLRTVRPRRVIGSNSRCDNRCPFRSGGSGAVGDDLHFDAHAWVPERGDTDIGPSRSVVGHVLGEQWTHGGVHEVLVARQIDVVGVHGDHIIPRRACNLEDASDIGESLRRLLTEVIGESHVAALPASLSGQLNAVADPDCHGEVLGEVWVHNNLALSHAALTFSYLLLLR